MLTWEPDKERALESTFHDSIPFLLFAPDEFREELIMRLKGLYTCCNPRSTDNFLEELKRINEMLKDYDFGESVNIHIVHLQTILKPFNQTLDEHSIRLQELEKQVKSLKKNNKKKEEGKEETEKHKPQMSVSVPKNLPKNLPENLQVAVLSQTPVHKTDIIKNCLKTSQTSLTIPELAGLTGLSTSNVANALNNLTDRDKSRLEKNFVLKDAKYGNTVRNLRYATYKWIDSLEEDQKNNDIESSYNDFEST